MTRPIDTLRHKLQQLQALHASGALGAEAYADARTAVERQIVDQVLLDGQAEPAAPARPSRGLQAGLIVGVLALALAGYAYTGAPGFTGVQSPAAAAPVAAGDGSPQVSDEQVAEIVNRLAQRLKDQPDDVAGWALLARAYSAMGRQAEAVPAYRKVLALGGENADLLADYADALGALKNGSLDAEAAQLVQRALALEPDNIKANALAGSLAYDQRDYAGAVRQWQKVERALPRDSRMLGQVQASIAQARQLAGLPALTAAAAGADAPAVMASASASAASAAATAISGSVSLAPALAARVAPEDTVFVFARAASGPRLPLAVLRKQVKDLPLNFRLDDSMAMAPNARISDHAQVIVSARISKSGQAQPQAGDLSGQAAAVAPGGRGVAVRISEVVGP